MPICPQKQVKWLRKKRIRNYAKINKRLVALGMPDTYLGYFLKTIEWEKTLENKKKKRGPGRPKVILDSIIALGIFLHFYLGLPYRQTVGYLSQYENSVGITIPSFKTLQRRGIDVNLSSYLPRAPLRGLRSCAIDSTCFVPSNRGHYIIEKWGVNQTSHQGWIKLHWITDCTTHQILAYEITDHKTGDATGALHLIPWLLKRRKNIWRLLGDRAYDVKEIFNILTRHAIKPGIRLKSNASTKARGSPSRAKEARYVKQHGYEGWKAYRKYGLRQAVEQSNAVFKNHFLECVTARLSGSLAAEFAQKIAIFNWMMSVER